MTPLSLNQKLLRGAFLVVTGASIIAIVATLQIEKFSSVAAEDGHASQAIGAGREIAVDSRVTEDSRNELRRIIRHGIRLGDLEKLAEAIRSCAIASNQSTGEIAAKLAEAGRSLDDQMDNLMVISAAFSAPSEIVDIYNSLSSAKLKEQHLLTTLARFRTSHDLNSILQLIEALPLGKGRIRAAEEASECSIETRGGEATLELISGFEMEEERQHALLILAEKGMLDFARQDAEMTNRIENLGLAAEDLQRGWGVSDAAKAAKSTPDWKFMFDNVPANPDSQK